MNLAKDIKPISYVKANAAEIIEHLQKTHRPLVITQHGEAKAVLIDTESYHLLTETIALLKIVHQSEREVSEGKFKKHETLFKELRKRYKIST